MVLIVTLLVALFLGQGIAQDIKPCASGCVNGVFGNAGSVGCSMNDLVCVCGKTEQFTDGIRDCVLEACKDEDPNAQLPLAQSMGTDQCKAASSAAGLLSSPTPAPSQPTPTPPQPQPTSSTEQSPSSPPSVSAAEAPSASAASPSTTSSAQVSSSEQALGAATADPNASSSISTSVSGSGSAAVEPTSATHSSTSSATSGKASAATESTSAEKSDEGSSTSQDGLSVAARAGIGAGVGVAAVLLGILAFCLCMRRRKQKKAAAAAAAAPSMQISQPLPGSGRQYADSTPQAEAVATVVPKNPATQSTTTQRSVSPITPPYSPSAASYSSELDANARRYEDMLPRTQPRTMI